MPIDRPKTLRKSRWALRSHILLYTIILARLYEYTILYKSVRVSDSVTPSLVIFEIRLKARWRINADDLFY